MKNIYRIIFWGFILIICITLGILGVIKDNEVFNSNKTKLNEIVNNFNNSLILKDYEARNISIKAKLKGRSIVIDYSGSEIKTYKYKFIDNYLEIKYDMDDSYGYLFTMLMADAISEYYEQSDEAIYPLFNDRSVFNYNLNEGIEISKKYNSYIVKLNTDIPIKVPITITNEDEENTLE